MFKIEIFENKNIPKEVENFLLNHENGSFFESKEWMIFNENYFKRKSFFVSIKEDKEIKLVGLILVNALSFKYNYLYCPAGPVYNFEDNEIFLYFIKEMKKIAKKENAIFLRLEPRIKYSHIDRNNLKSFNILYKTFIEDYKFKISNDQKQPENTIQIDLEKYSEEDLLKQMKEKGRYNIKIAQKNNIQIKRTNIDQKDIDVFYNLTRETTQRNGFFSNDKDYYECLLKTFRESNKNSIYLYSACIENEIIASAIAVFLGNKVIYYYGASTSNEVYRKFTAPYLLQWEMIKDAKKMNYKYYDFLGVSPIIDEIDSKFYIFEALRKHEFNKKEDAEKFLQNHKFYGITQFKKRFGGDFINYPGAIDKIYNPILYSCLNFLKTIRKTLRKILKVRI